MKQTTIMMMVFLAICVSMFTSCSKNDDDKGGDETVTLNSSISVGSSSVSEYLTVKNEVYSIVNKYYEEKLRPYAKVSETGPLSISVKKSDLATVKVILNGLNADDLSLKLDGASNLSSCNIKILEGITDIHAYEYKTVTYNATGEWKHEKDGNSMLLRYQTRQKKRATRKP